MNNDGEIQRDIGDKLKHLRIKNGYSSYENFAVDNELSRMQYWRIEKGLTNLTLKSLIRILNIHQITIDDFFKMKAPKNGTLKNGILKDGTLKNGTLKRGKL
jgi:transcriptional regulator with XRE-family HTH domain